MEELGQGWECSDCITNRKGATATNIIKVIKADKPDAKEKGFVELIPAIEEVKNNELILVPGASSSQILGRYALL